MQGCRPCKMVSHHKIAIPRPILRGLHGGRWGAGAVGKRERGKGGRIVSTDLS